MKDEHMCIKCNERRVVNIYYKEHLIHSLCESCGTKFVDRMKEIDSIDSDLPTRLEGSD